MKKQIVIVINVICFLAVMSQAAPFSKKKEQPSREESEREILRSYLENVRDSLQFLTVEYYALKQQGVDQRLADKDDFERLHEVRENRTAEIARIREEIFSHEQSLREATEQYEQKRLEIKTISLTVLDAASKEADDILESFPIDREVRRGQFESVRINENMPPEMAMRTFVDYKIDWINRAMTSDISKHRVLLENETVVDLSIARLGSLLAYGVDSSGTYYAIRQTGRLGAARYIIESIESLELNTALAASFPQWLNDNALNGSVTMDVMLNDQSAVLISGQKTSGGKSFIKFIKSGGPIMFPLALVALWGIIIVIIKLFTLRQKHKNDSNFYNRIIEFLDKMDITGALSLATSQRGVVARVAATCIQHSKWSRESAEKAVREILVEEIPILGKYINTLGVIATAAPLLGLLGTVTGMINVFEVITHYGTGDPKILAGGISEALVTTEIGLIIAVPVVLLHNYIRNKKDSIQSEMERHAIGIINRLWK